MDDRNTPDAAEESRPAGLFHSGKALLATLMGIAHTRVELISTEVEEQFARMVSLLVWGLVALFLAFTGVILSAIAFIVPFWHSNRALEAGGPPVVFVGLAVIPVFGYITTAKARPRLFEASLEELAKDRDQLKSG